MAITFDAAAKRIVLDSASVTATEIYSRWVDWAATSDNCKYGMVIRQVGSDDLGGGLSIPPYYFLQGAWRVRPMEADHDLTITGNLFVEGGGTPVVRTLGPYQVNVNYTVPVQAQGISTTGSTGPSASDIAAAILAAAQITPIHATTQDRIVEAALTEADFMRIVLAALAGKTSGLGSQTEQYLAQDGVKPRITATFDQNNNRDVVVLDGTI